MICPKILNCLSKLGELCTVWFVYVKCILVTKYFLTLLAIFTLCKYGAYPEILEAIITPRVKILKHAPNSKNTAANFLSLCVRHVPSISFK